MTAISVPARVSATRSYVLACKWEALDMLRTLPVVATIQLFIATAMVFGFGLLIPQVDAQTAQYLATGAPTVALVTVGLVLVPQTIAARRMTGGIEYLQSLPIARLAPLFATLTVNGAFAIPGALLAVLIASWHYGFDVTWSLALIPIMAASALTLVSLGYALAIGVTQPQVVSLATNALILVTLLFAPVNVPANRLPSWLASIHEWLPIGTTAALVRSSLTGTSPQVTDMVVVGVWTGLALLLASRAAVRTT